jgi:uncharacterized membrane protein YbhN (UPF0104 family)
MKPTRFWLPPLLIVVVGGLVYLWLDRAHPVLPSLSAFAPVFIGVLAAADAYVAFGTRARLVGRPRTQPISPLTVARLAALGKASTIVGALLTGGYVALLARTAQLGSDVARHDLRVAIGGGICGVGLCAAGLVLESVCRVKHPPGSGEE